MNENDRGWDDGLDDLVGGALPPGPEDSTDREVVDRTIMEKFGRMAEIMSGLPRGHQGSGREHAPIIATRPPEEGEPPGAVISSVVYDPNDNQG